VRFFLHGLRIVAPSEKRSAPHSKRALGTDQVEEARVTDDRVDPRRNFLFRVPAAIVGDAPVIHAHPRKSGAKEHCR
jgi:hypothetical protein